MTSEDKRLEQILKALALTRDIEIDCTTCLDLVPAYVDREVAGEDVAQEMPVVHQHLAVCRDCFEEYEAVSDLARQEAETGLPEASVLLRQLHSHVGDA